jgi:primosomal protein N'
VPARVPQADGPALFPLAAAPSSAPLVSVAVPVPRLGVLTYRAPVGSHVAPGMRVRVPLGSRVVTGWVVDLPPAALDDEDSALPRPARGERAGVRGSRVKEIVAVLDAEAFFPEEVLRLALWTASYYLCGAGETIAAASPPLARGERSAFKQQRVARLLGAVAADQKLTEKQKEALAVLSEAPEGIALAALATQGISNAVIAGLAKRQLVAVEDAARSANASPFSTADSPTANATINGIASAAATSTSSSAPAPPCSRR